MHSEFIEANDKRWKENLASCNYEFYHLPQYSQLETELINGIPLAWYGKMDGQWILIPLVKRTIPEEITNGKQYYDLISPYGYPGILFNSSINNYQIAKLLGRFKEDAKKNTCISTFIRLNPFNNARLLDENEEVRQVVHGEVVCLDMHIEYKKRYMEYSSQKRRDIKKLKEKGFTVSWNNFDMLENFKNIYDETMQRQNADEYYYFPESYYMKLKKMMGKLNLDFVMAKNKDGKAVAGSLFMNNGKVMQYHLSGTATEYLRVAPVNLIFDEILKKYSGKLRYFNLGGGVGNERDSLFRFKARFGKEYRKFSTLRIINDRQRYNNLCQNFTKKELYNLEIFFPLYRK